MQLITSNDTATTEADYLEVIQRQDRGSCSPRRAASAPCVAERPQAEEAGARRFGLNLGIAFQLIDDMLDYLGAAGRARQERRRRFPRGQDHPAGRPRLCAAATRRSARSGAAPSRRWSSSADDLDRAIALIERHGALAETLARARAYAAAAIAALAPFADGPERRALTDAAAFCRRPQLLNVGGCKQPGIKPRDTADGLAVVAAAALRAGEVGAIDRGRSAECSSAW